MEHSLDEIVDFCWERNPVWHTLVTKEKIRNYIGIKDYIVVTQEDKIVGVGIYLKDKIHTHFISLTVRKGYNGMKIIRYGLKEVIKKEKPKFVSWLTPEYRLRTMEVR